MATTDEDTPADLQEADARLMSKAPELRDKVEDLAELIETNLVTGEVSREAWEEELKAALAVINAVKGKLP